MLPVIMLVVGLYLYFRKRLTVRGREISPRSVQTVGCLLAAPVPLSFVAGMCWGLSLVGTYASSGAMLSDPNVVNTANALSLVLTLVCLGAAVWVAYQAPAAAAISAAPSQIMTLRQASAYSRLTEGQLMLLIRANALPALSAMDGYRVESRLLDLWMYMERGAHEYNRGQYAAAVQDFSRALALDPTLADAYAWRGLAMLRMGRQADAVTQFRQALAHEKDMTERATLARWLSAPQDAPLLIEGREPVAERVVADWLAGRDTPQEQPAAPPVATEPRQPFVTTAESPDAFDETLRS